jgi:hypothetical protein
MTDKTTVTLELSPRAVELLRNIGAVYVAKGGPAWECAQEWDEAFTTEELAELESAIDNATEAFAPASPRP